MLMPSIADRLETSVFTMAKFSEIKKGFRACNKLNNPHGTITM
jgi:hypothetical protein